jgi:hypothetical protein
LTGYISEGIALCGKGQTQDAIEAFDLATMFTDRQSKTILLLIKAGQIFLICSLVHHGSQAIALFNAEQNFKAAPHVHQPPNPSPDGDTHACSIVEVSIMDLIQPSSRLILI